MLTTPNMKISLFSEYFRYFSVSGASQRTGPMRFTENCADSPEPLSSELCNCFFCRTRAKPKSATATTQPSRAGELLPLKRDCLSSTSSHGLLARMGLGIESHLSSVPMLMLASTLVAAARPNAEDTAGSKSSRRRLRQARSR